MSDNDIYINYSAGVWGDRTKIRDMTKIHFPESESPDKNVTFIRGGEECRCICKPKYLPRNIILLRPRNKASSKPLYNAMVLLWRGGHFKRLSHGTCQQAITACNVKEILRPIKDNVKIGCIDNIDGNQLQSGDVVLTRIGDRNVGKPYRIL